MFGHSSGAQLPYDYATSEFPAPPLFIAIPGGGGGGGCSSYGGSPTSYSPTLIQRSISSYSLHKNSDAYSPMNSSSPPSYYDCDTSYVRKVLSTGNLQQRCNSTSALVNENTSIIESMSRASPYSPDEKRERIERYRSKRNLRNFNKKIKYECRKTLADSRPRIRGRFARNDEIEQTTPRTQWERTTTLEDEADDDDEYWTNFLDSFSASFMP